jgi:hypothetical protein
VASVQAGEQLSLENRATTVAGPALNSLSAPVGDQRAGFAILRRRC